MVLALQPRTTNLELATQLKNVRGKVAEILDHVQMALVFVAHVMKKKYFIEKMFFKMLEFVLQVLVGCGSNSSENSTYFSSSIMNFK